MKKIVFFIPAITLTLFYVWAALMPIGAVHPVVLALLASLWIAGILLSKRVFWGGAIGILPAACFIYMGTQDTGQIISETPIGLVLLLYYAVCMLCVYRGGRSKRKAGQER